KRPRRSRFSIGFAPLTSITESDAQISGGETRQDYKDPRRFPLVAPSCALLFLPFGLPVSFRCYGRVFSFHA
ncbi:TPA: plasmid replication initiation protein, partial [Escherichia coli]|nr:plasmid replication initiation protein [Escherichia coli]